jgi:hypothetical protein
MLHGVAVLHNGFVTFNPKEVSYHSNKCLELYYSTQVKNKRTHQRFVPIILGEDGGDVGVVALIIQAMSLAALGQLDKSFEIWREATNWAKVGNP